MCAERDARSPLVSSRERVWAAQDDTDGLARNWASRRPHCLFHCGTLGPCLLGPQGWRSRFYREILPAPLQVLSAWPHLIHISSQGSKYLPKDIIGQSASPSSNDTLLSCSQTGTIYWGPLPPTENHASPLPPPPPPSPKWSRVFTLKILRVWLDFKVGHTPSSCHPMYYVFSCRLFVLK